MTDRDSIVSALSTLPELDVNPTLPDNITAGKAWPVRAPSWTPTETMACLLWNDRWYAYVALPNGTRATAIEAADDMIEPLGDALFEAGLSIELAELVDVQVAAGATDTVPALRFTLAD